jgi:hypothetical protein
LTDIERMVRPSWLTKPPVLSGGKLKADDWRSLCTTTLPMSLIRLWSNKPADEHHTQLLEMTMCLVSAVIIICSRTTSKAHADEYLELMFRYRELLQSKFPTFVAKPNFHMALHIPEFLLMYGPVHGWWTFPFERLIGTLQKVPTNYIPGELWFPFLVDKWAELLTGKYEATTAESFARITKLRALFDSAICTQAINACKEMFEKAVAPRLRDTHLVDAIMYSPSNTYARSKQQKLPLPLSEAFERFRQERPHVPIPTSAVFRSHITVKGIRYSTRQQHRGNSAVLLPKAENASEKIPVHIEHILETKDGLFVAVSLYQSLVIPNNPFSRYPVFGAEMWYWLPDDPKESRMLYIVDASLLETHFASWEIPWKVDEVTYRLSVIVPLRRVSHSSCLLNYTHLVLRII